jgi:large subunit ribosomal protein L14
MKAIAARMTNGIQHGTEMETCDNSGAKTVRVISILRHNTTTKGRKPECGVGCLVQVAVKSGRQDVRKQVFFAVITRQRKEYRRLTGIRVKFEDNSCVICKDEKGNPKGTVIKGPVAKEVCDRWPAIAKLSSITV